MRTTDFSKIDGFARIVWTLKTETALCIKSGTTSVLRKNKFNKAPHLDFNRKELIDKSNKEESLVADFAFDAVIIENRLVPQFRVPASSLRGCLRNFTIKQLIPEKFWLAALQATAENGDEGEARAIHTQWLKDAFSQPGWRVVQNLFGLATDGGDAALSDETVAGRLRVRSGDCIDMPENRQKIVDRTRNPMDRCIQAGKGGGLHTFMVLPAGNTFKVSLDIVNPTPADLGLVDIWKEYINNGRIKFGGAGKARLSVDSDLTELYLRPRISPDSFPGAARKSATGTDPLAGFFIPYTLNSDANRTVYRKALKDMFASITQGRESADVKE